MTAKKALPSLQLGPKSLTCTPSCLLTCDEKFQSPKLLLSRPQPAPGPTEVAPSWLQPSIFPESSCWCCPRAQTDRHQCWNHQHHTMTTKQRSRLDKIDDKAKTTEDWISQVRPASIAGRSWSSLAKFLENPRVLLNLEKSESEKCFSHFVHFPRNKKRKRTSYWSSESVINLTHCCVPEINSFLWYLKWKLNWIQVRMRMVWTVMDIKIIKTLSKHYRDL